MSHSQNSHMIAVAIGATIGVIGAASLFIYQKIMEHRERKQVRDNLENVNRRVAELQAALDNMRTQQAQKPTRRESNLRKRVTSANSTAQADAEVDAMSVTETDIDDEFYDCSDDEVTMELMDNEKAGVTELSHQLDVLDKKFENADNYEEVLCDLRLLAITYNNNVEVIWRLARACFKIASNITDTKDQDVLLQEGIQLCDKVLHEEHVDLHKWYAMLVGSRAQYLPKNEKLQAGKKFEKHVKLSLKLRPDDPTLNHLLGRFQYTVSGLSWTEKKVCGILFGEVPTATYSEAIEHLQKFEKYATEPDIENKYFLAKSYLKIKSYRKCIDLLKELGNLPACNKEHEAMQSEAMELIANYSNYY